MKILSPLSLGTIPPLRERVRTVQVEHPLRSRNQRRMYTAMKRRRRVGRPTMHKVPPKDDTRKNGNAHHKRLAPSTPGTRQNVGMRPPPQREAGPVLHSHKSSHKSGGVRNGAGREGVAVRHLLIGSRGGDQQDWLGWSIKNRKDYGKQTTDPVDCIQNLRQPGGPPTARKELQGEGHH